MEYVDKNHQEIQKVSESFILKAFYNVIKIEYDEMVLLNSLKSVLYSEDVSGNYTHYYIYDNTTCFLSATATAIIITISIKNMLTK